MTTWNLKNDSLKSKKMTTWNLKNDNLKSKKWQHEI